jgi:hypothetical protein
LVFAEVGFVHDWGGSSGRRGLAEGMARVVPAEVSERGLSTRLMVYLDTKQIEHKVYTVQRR